MKLIGINPDSKGWGIQRNTLPDGRHCYVTGYYTRHNNNRYQEVPNVIIEGKFRRSTKSKYLFIEKETQDTYSITKNAESKFLNAFLLGYLTAVDGYACGLFTFSKEGSAVSLCPYFPKGKRALIKVDEAVPMDALTENEILADL